MNTDRTAQTPRCLLRMAVSDGSAQESSRTLTFTGPSQAVVAGAPVDLTRQANGELALSFRYRIDAPAQWPVHLGMGSTAVPVTDLLAAAPTGEWRTMKVRLSCFRDAGANMASADVPFVLAATGGLTITVEDIRLAPNNNDTVCPAA